MAGPGVSILFDFHRDESVVAAIRHACHSTATHIEGDDFWVESTSTVGGSYAGEGRPFIMWFADASDDVELGEDIGLYTDALGWSPKLSFGLADNVQPGPRPSDFGRTFLLHLPNPWWRNHNAR